MKELQAYLFGRHISVADVMLAVGLSLILAKAHPAALVVIVPASWLINRCTAALDPARSKKGEP